MLVQGKRSITFQEVSQIFAWVACPRNASKAYKNGVSLPRKRLRLKVDDENPSEKKPWFLVLGVSPN